MSHASRDGSPVTPASPIQVRVLRIGEGETVHVRTLSPKIGGMMTHFVRGRSHYCSGDTCNRAHHATPQIWKGYVAVEKFERNSSCWVPFVLELTEHSEQDMRGIYARGQGWELAREMPKDKRHGPVMASLVQVLDAKTRPPAFDVRQVLCHVYHVTDLRLDVVNPLPPRLMLPPSPFVSSKAEAPKRG